jgi:hypothetical protein
MLQNTGWDVNLTPKAPKQDGSFECGYYVYEMGRRILANETVARHINEEEVARSILSRALEYNKIPFKPATSV